MRFLKAVSILAAVCGFNTNASAEPHADPSSQMVTVNGHHIMFHVTAGKLPALVLDAGGGTDSSYWKSIVPALAQRTGSEIITYDRAGLGASDEVPPPFRIEDSVTDLESGLKTLGATRDLILIPHSFAGEVATYLALKHPDWVSGAVLVDTNVPEFFSNEEIDHLDPVVRPMIAAGLAAHADKRTRTLESIEETTVTTSVAFHQVTWPMTISCYVIVSQTTPFPPITMLKLDRERWTQAHADFAAKAPNRVLVIAKGSSHDAAHDRPDMIVDAVVDIIRRTRAGSPNGARPPIKPL